MCFNAKSPVQNALLQISSQSHLRKSKYLSQFIVILFVLHRTLIHCIKCKLLLSFKGRCNKYQLEVACILQSLLWYSNLCTCKNLWYSLQGNVYSHMGHVRDASEMHAAGRVWDVSGMRRRRIQNMTKMCMRPCKRKILR